VDHGDPALAEWARRDCDCIAGFDHEMGQIGRERNHRDVFVAAPSSLGYFVRIGEGAEGAPDLIGALDRFDPKIVSEGNIQSIVLPDVVKDMGRSAPVYPSIV
jgi:hypothetical protein